MYNTFSGYPAPTGPYQYNPFGQSAMPNQSMQQSQMQNSYAPKYEIVHVNGENGAKSFRMAPNSQCILLDDTAPIVWLCQSDGAGYHTVTPYSIAPYQAQQAPDFSSLETRIKRLEEIYESNVASTRTDSKTTSE